MQGKAVLILGGTRDAVDLASLLDEAGFAVTTSLAGVTRSPVIPKGSVRSGGFGGSAGMAAYLKDTGFAALVDATHPFAAQISASGHEAAKLAGIPYVRLERPCWLPQAGDKWISVADVRSAIDALPANAKVFLTIGRKAVTQFMARPDLTGLARMIELPPSPLEQGWTVMLARPPFAVEDEKALMELESVTHLVTKNAGGELTSSKLVAARELGLPVIMIERPTKPDAPCFSEDNNVLNFLIENISA